MEKTMLHRVNAMPAPTWNRLRINDAKVEIPERLSDARAASVEADGRLFGEADAFDSALEELRSMSAAFETGMGPEAFDYLRTVSGTPTVLATVPGQKGAVASVRVEGVDGGANVAALDVVAAADSDLTVHVDLDSPDAGSGVVGSSLRVFAGRGARVIIVSTQTLDDSWIALDDTGMVLDAHARVDVRHTVLGAGRSYTGLAGDLRGEASRIAIDTRYLGHGRQERDFNYLLRHHGVATMSAMDANGVLSGESEKTLRGTIDLIRGCKGASGQETETVLLVDDRTTNRTVPVILCGEDDVAGNHGATIGHVRPEQLFYLQSRGLSPEASEQLFTRATVEEALITAPDTAARAGVIRLGKTLLDDFGQEVGA